MSLLHFQERDGKLKDLPLELGQCFCLMLKPLNLRLNVRMTKGMSLGREVAVSGSGFDDVVSMGFIKMLSKLACACTHTSAHFGW